VGFLTLLQLGGVFNRGSGQVFVQASQVALFMDYTLGNPEKSTFESLHTD